MSRKSNTRVYKLKNYGNMTLRVGSAPVAQCKFHLYCKCGKEHVWVSNCNEAGTQLLECAIPSVLLGTRSRTPWVYRYYFSPSTFISATAGIFSSPHNSLWLDVFGWHKEFQVLSDHKFSPTSPSPSHCPSWPILTIKMIKMTNLTKITPSPLSLRQGSPCSASSGIPQEVWSIPAHSQILFHSAWKEGGQSESWMMLWKGETWTERVASYQWEPPGQEERVESLPAGCAEHHHRYDDHHH